MHACMHACTYVHAYVRVPLRCAPQRVSSLPSRCGAAKAGERSARTHCASTCRRLFLDDACASCGSRKGDGLPYKALSTPVVILSSGDVFIKRLLGLSAFLNRRGTRLMPRLHTEGRAVKRELSPDTLILHPRAGRRFRSTVSRRAAPRSLPPSPPSLSLSLSIILCLSLSLSLSLSRARSLHSTEIMPDDVKAQQSAEFSIL